MKPEPSTKSPPCHRDSRAVLIGVAGEIFAERGNELTTIKEITDRAGANVASVNYYFRDKLGLYTEVLRQSLHNGAMAFPADTAELTADERLRGFIWSFMKSLVSLGRPSWTGRLVVRELAQPTAALPQVVEEIIRPNFLILRQIVGDVAGCPLNPETLDLLTHSVMAQCVHWKTSAPIFPYLWPALEFNEAQVRRIADHIAAFSIAGIRAAIRAEAQVA